MFVVIVGFGKIQGAGLHWPGCIGFRTGFINITKSQFIQQLVNLTRANAERCPGVNLNMTGLDLTAKELVHIS